MIKLFTTGCPKCKVLKAKLDAKKIPYETSMDINHLIEKGYISLPILLVDDKYLDYLKAVDFVNNY